jgi:hypothetical protein
MDDGTGAGGGLSRRALIRRGAIIGGVVWAAPVVQSMTSPAFAAGSEVTHDPCTATFFVKYHLPTSEHRFGFWSGTEGTGRWSCRPPSYDAAIKPSLTGKGHAKAAGGALVSWANVAGAGNITAVYVPKTRCLTITPPGSCRLFEGLVKQGGHCVPVPLAAPYPSTRQFFSGRRGSAISYVSLVLCCN